MGKQSYTFQTQQFDQRFPFKGTNEMSIYRHAAQAVKAALVGDNDFNAPQKAEFSSDIKNADVALQDLMGLKTIKITNREQMIKHVNDAVDKHLDKLLEEPETKKEGLSTKQIMKKIHGDDGSARKFRKDSINPNDDLEAYKEKQEGYKKLLEEAREKDAKGGRGLNRGNTNTRGYSK